MAKPFQSKFIPYVDQIKAWRRAGKTWQEVARQLTDMGIKADPGNVCRVMGRIKRRPYPLGAEPDAERKAPVEIQSVSQPAVVPESQSDIYDHACEVTRQQENKVHVTRTIKLTKPINL